VPTTKLLTHAVKNSAYDLWMEGREIGWSGRVALGGYWRAEARRLRTQHESLASIFPGRT
jgi:hypothetical protein